LLRETSTLGVRIQQVQRLKAQRSQQRITTPLGEVLVKVKRLGGRVISAAPEYAECQRIANTLHIPLSDVYEVAQQVILTDIIQQ
jgi:pyridinium-3,5-bisthiocarboxylic acid mononucleotide nickel chelatase